MAPRSKKLQNLPKEKEFEESSLLEYSKMAIKTIGHYTMEQRAVPDFRDGMKPVQRRIVWAMIKLGLSSRSQVVKSARVVGDVIGKYHPHGDTAVYEAMVRMNTDFLYPLVDGKGNWGNMLDDAAAMRYTEVRLSRLSDLAFGDKDYLDVSDYIPNYDGKDVEPVILPSKIPMLLLCGAFGILFGGTCCIPAFDIHGVFKLTKAALRGKKITAKKCLRYLEPTSSYGGYAYVDEDDEDTAEDLKNFYGREGIGRGWWMPDYDVDVDTRSILVHGFPPRATGIPNPLTVLEKMAADSDIESVEPEHTVVDGRPKMQWRVTVKKNVIKSRAKLEEYLEGLAENFQGGQKFVYVTTQRKFDASVGECDIEMLTEGGLENFFPMWAEWRIELERRVLALRIEKAQKEMDKQNLHLKMVLNREVIVKALDAEDSHAVLVKKLKVTPEQADYILHCQILTLKRMLESQIRDKIKEIEADIAKNRKLYDDPVDSICADLDKILKEVG